MPVDLNNSEFIDTRNFELIPAKTIAPMVIHVEFDDGVALRNSRVTDAVWIKCKISITDGPYKGRRFYHNLTVSGGKLNDKGGSKGGVITGRTVRGIVESNRGIRSTATDEASVNGRVIGNWTDIHGMNFIGMVAVEPRKDGFPESNKLSRALSADDKDYRRQPSNGQPQAPVAPATVPEPVSPAPSPEPEPDATISSEAPPWAR